MAGERKEAGDFRGACASNKPIFMDTKDSNARASARRLQKWGGLAAFLLAVTFIAPRLIYLTGDLRSPLGQLTYDLGDFLYGPVWAASLVTLVFALRERISRGAPRRMSLALLAAVLAAGAMVSVACIRSANRHYHLIHPELHLEAASYVLVVWTTIVAGLTGAALHFLGWALVLVGSAGWASGKLPRLLSLLYFVVGAVSLFAYVLPGGEENAAALGVVAGIWQGIVLWRAEPEDTQTPEINANQLDQA